MSLPLTIVVEEVGLERFEAKVEESGSRYYNLLDTTSCTAVTAHQALAGMAEAVRMADLVLAERADRR